MSYHLAMTALPDQTPQLSEDEIFYGGFVRTGGDKTIKAVHQTDTQYGKAGQERDDLLLSISLDSFTPRIVNISSGLGQPIRQLIALCMVMGRRMDSTNQKLDQLLVLEEDNIKQSKDILKALNQSIEQSETSTARLIAQSETNTSRAIAAQQAGNENIVKALGELQRSMATMTKSDGVREQVAIEVESDLLTQRSSGYVQVFILGFKRNVFRREILCRVGPTLRPAMSSSLTPPAYRAGAPEAR